MKVTKKVHGELAAIRRERSAAKAGGTKKSPIRKTTKKAAPAKAAPKRAAASVAGVLKLPAIGSKLTRTYKGREIVVEVLKDGFRYEGATYSSLTAIAKKATGYKAISGPAFFGLWRRVEAK